MQLSKPSPSSKPEIVKLMTKFAERRQAQVNPSTLLTFADDLSCYSLGDIEAALVQIASVPRRDGETAFPEVATIFEAIRGVRRGKADSKAIEQENKRVAHYKANPDMYVSATEFAELVKPLNEKFGMEKPKVINTTPVEMLCPHCSQALPVAPNIRFWTPQELRTYADLVDENQRLADLNRNMDSLPLGDLAEAVHEA